MSITINDIPDIWGSDGLRCLNSFTKYPSIQTYHEINSGILNENLTDGMCFDKDEKIYITEKIDGTNSRIIVFNGDYIIGSREELLYHKGDMFGNPSQSIVDTVKPIAEDICRKIARNDKMYVFYGETYGSNINGFKHYTSHKTAGFRFFDITITDMTEEDAERIFNMSLDSISSWREHGGQHFVSVDVFHKILDDLGFPKDARVPYIREDIGGNIPVSLDEVYSWLKEFESTNAVLDDDFERIGGRGRAEGVVVRNGDRSKIRKIRFEDYAKTFRKNGIKK